jgi:methionine biosynthesis protein MetW
VAFPNFGHWSVRLAHLFTGRAPKTKLFPHDWFDSPNIHFFTVDDFEGLVQLQKWTIEKRIFLQGARQITMLPNLFAEVAVFLVRS